MSTKSTLRNALSNIDDAKRKLKRLRGPENEQIDYEIRRVIRELDDAESSVNRALREVIAAER